MSLVYQKATGFNSTTAIVDGSGSHSYSDLETQSDYTTNYLIKAGVRQGDRVAFLIAPNFDFVTSLFGIWKSGAIAVPLCTIYPSSEIQYIVDDTQCDLLIYGTEFTEIVSQLKNVKCVSVSKFCSLSPSVHHPSPEPNDPSLILYTSGTTNKPKGVVHTHQSLNATISTLIDAWKWTENDYILHVLPLHHTHGLINKLLCALSARATCEFLPKFDAKIIWNTFSEGNITLFMAVPTIYSKLINYWDEQPNDRQKELSKSCKNLRLMVSGSAALPVPVLDKWEAISGHRLLERYGMTEIGMAISNPYDGERKAGYIGKVLPGVEARLVDENDFIITEENEQGEIQIKGHSVFKEYWKKPEITAESFTKEGWFKTGDSAVVEKGYYKILGRNSVDIIKSGGYKISALEIESKLLDHSEIGECAVVGIPDNEWGEVIAIAVVLTHAALREPQCTREPRLTLERLASWAKDKMAPYKIPRRVIVLDKLPRNVLGKVTKNEVKKLF